MPEITRPGIKSTVHVSDRVAAFWLKNGWQLVDGEELGEVLVFARSKNAATEAARAQGLTPKQWRYVSEPGDLTDAGGHGRPVIVTDDFSEHRDHEAIRIAAVEAGIDLSSASPADD